MYNSVKLQLHNKTSDEVSVWLTEENSLQVPCQSAEWTHLRRHPHLLPAVPPLDPDVSQQCCSCRPESAQTGELRSALNAEKYWRVWYEYYRGGDVFFFRQTFFYIWNLHELHLDFRHVSLQATQPVEWTGASRDVLHLFLQTTQRVVHLFQVDQWGESAAVTVWQIYKEWRKLLVRWHLQRSKHDCKMNFSTQTHHGNHYHRCRHQMWCTLGKLKGYFKLNNVLVVRSWENSPSSIRGYFLSLGLETSLYLKACVTKWSVEFT